MMNYIKIAIITVLTLSIVFTVFLLVYKYSKIEPPNITSNTTNILSNSANIITKAQWVGHPAIADLTKLESPADRVIIFHTATMDCDMQSNCIHRVRMIQQFHIQSFNFDDISYNFLIGNDGNIYEGRGWNYQGALVKGYNTDSIGIAFIGTYISVIPNDAALQAAKSLIETGVQLGKLRGDYKLYGARQLTATESPGNALYNVIKRWTHWSKNIFM